AYERRSVAVTSNLHPSGFDTIMPETLATATVDRLLHHAHIVVTQGDSYRLAQATSGKGVSNHKHTFALIAPVPP
ncbi:MAG: ATP-binding protein, partial [Pseudonocardiaceae bacterium]